MISYSRRRHARPADGGPAATATPLAVRLPSSRCLVDHLRCGARGLLLLAGLLLPGCFQLREPEPATVASEWNTPTQIDILLTNFTAAVEKLNAANYERTFSGPDFRFMPDPSSAGTVPALFANWSVTEESNYLNSLRRRTPTGTINQLTLSDRRDNLYTADSAEVSATYNLRIVQTDTTFHAKELRGNLTLKVRRRNNEWRIAGWRDQRTGPGPCWTDLKIYFITH